MIFPREELEMKKKEIDDLNEIIGSRQDKILLGVFREIKLKQEIGRLNAQVEYLQKDNARLYFLLNPKREENDVQNIES